jgi:spoIIIJ-associated protein
MEWVETTGRTIADAKEAALDELGVDEQDAEFEVLEEPRNGLFGRLRSEGRVRARVRPMAPRAKDDRRRRGRTAKPSGAKAVTAPAEATPATGGSPAEAGAESVAAPPRPGSSPKRSGSNGDEGAPADEAASEGPKRNPARRAPSAPQGQDRDAEPAGGGHRERRPSKPRQTERTSTRGEGNEVDVSLDEQSMVAEAFLRGLVQEFGVSADIASSQPDDDTLDLTLTGDDLGMLIGPKGATLLAIQDLTRTVVQRKTGAGNGRIHVDVSGYRQKRSEALSRFARQVAEEVRRTGTRKALEPMSAPDRKVVHDALTDVDGVTTASEGEDTARRVVILPHRD